MKSSFENMLLPTLDGKSNEPVITDFSKMNLVVFTASWCTPCREEIPLLKEIYNDLKTNLIITYITLDDKKTIETFKDLLRNENIPFRTLLASREDEDIRKKYFIVRGIPHVLLVYPDKRMDIIEIRDGVQKEKLYAVCKRF